MELKNQYNKEVKSQQFLQGKKGFFKLESFQLQLVHLFSDIVFLFCGIVIVIIYICLIYFNYVTVVRLMYLLFIILFLLLYKFVVIIIKFFIYLYGEYKSYYCYASLDVDKQNLNYKTKEVFEWERWEKKYFLKLINFFMLINLLKNPILFIYILLNKRIYFLIRHLNAIKSRFLRKFLSFLLIESGVVFILRLFSLFYKFLVIIQNRPFIEIIFFRFVGLLLQILVITDVVFFFFHSGYFFFVIFFFMFFICLLFFFSLII